MFTRSFQTAMCGAPVIKTYFTAVNSKGFQSVCYLSVDDVATFLREGTTLTCTVSSDYYRRGEVLRPSDI